MIMLEFIIVGVCLFFVATANPIHGVLSLVVVGLGFAGLLLGAALEFTALIIVLVYVGAVTVLFIFVVMMVNLRSTPVGYITVESFPAWLFLGAALLTGGNPGGFRSGTPVGGDLNLVNLGESLYGGPGVYGVFLVGLVLFVAMIAAICLSLVGGENYRTQEFYSQIRRSNGVFTLKVR